MLDEVSSIFVFRNFNTRLLSLSINITLGKGGVRLGKENQDQRVNELPK